MSINIIIWILRNIHKKKFRSQKIFPASEFLNHGKR
jgi:hypothetical protein